ncbi:MAG: alanine racemase [Polyangiaceae bacterium]
MLKNDAYRAWKTAIQGHRLPTAIVLLDAVDANLKIFSEVMRAHPEKKLRVATKSIRCPELIRYVKRSLGDTARGLMTYTAEETEFWANEGERDLLLAYPTMSTTDAEAIARANKLGAVASVVVDEEAHLAPLASAAEKFAVQIPLVIELDLAYRQLGSLVHLGVRRSSVREPEEVVKLAKKIAETRALRFHGVMGYEAQIAGVGDDEAAARAMKVWSRGEVATRRAAVRESLERAGLSPLLFNGGGSGSIRSTVEEKCLTEVTAGSGFLDSHLFDHYRDLPLEPAIAFALQVVRRPSPDFVTVHGGGFVASGKAGVDRLPIPWLPEGLSLTALEGAGEVQTPIANPAKIPLDLGDPIFFMHAKAGELAEHFDKYLLVRGDRVESKATTYRGLGKVFLG